MAAEAQAAGPFSLSPGTRLEEFEVQAPLGAGGMGEVYLAWDHELQREVALKVLRAAPWLGPHARVRLAEEARAMARLSHPNIVTVHRMGSLGQRPFLVMERLHGAPLSARRGTPSDPEAVARWLLAAARALATAHAAGILHRDLKPENLFLCEDGTLKVLDFGLAALGDAAAEDLAPAAGARRALGQAQRAAAPAPPLEETAPLEDGLFDDASLGTRSVLLRIHETGLLQPVHASTAAPAPTLSQETRWRGALLGTPRYLAPEQWQGLPAEPASDLWALGVVGYELLTGVDPFPASGLAARRARVLSGRPPTAIRDLVPEVPEALADLVHRLLTPDRAERLGEAAALVASLQGLTAADRQGDGDPADAGPDAAAPRARAWPEPAAPLRYPSLEAMVARWEICHPTVLGHHSPSGRDIPAYALQESLAAFREAGGDVSALLGRLNAKIAVRAGEAGFVPLSAAVIEDPANYFSNEIYFLLVMAMKAALGDPRFAFRPSEGTDLGVGHKIYEAGPIAQDPIANAEEDFAVSGRTFGPLLRFTQQVGPPSPSGQSAEDRFLAALNTLLPEAQALRAAQLADEGIWVHVSVTQRIFELAKVISGRGDVVLRSPSGKFPAVVSVIKQLLPVASTYRLVARYASQYTTSMQFEVRYTSIRRAVVRLHQRPALADLHHPYYPACFRNSLDATRGTMAKIPPGLYGLPCTVKERTWPTSTASQGPGQEVPEEAGRWKDWGDGDAPWSDVHFQYPPRLTGYQRLVAPAGIATLVAAPALAWLWQQDLPLGLQVLGTTQGLSLPVLAYLAARSRRLGREVRERTQFIQQQQRNLDQLRCRESLLEVRLRAQRLREPDSSPPSRQP